MLGIDRQIFHCQYLKLTKKYVILPADQEYLLYKRTEFMFKCSNRNNYLMKNIKDL